MNELYNHT